MLKAIDPILNADVLYALRAMGHGDDVVICDTNFPADSVARQTVFGELLRIDNVTAARAAKAILSVMPLDAFVDKPALRMEIVGNAERGAAGPGRGAEGGRRGRGQVLADGLGRALRLLRSRQEGLLRHPDRRAALLWLLRLQEGRDPARRRLRLGP